MFTDGQRKFDDEDAKLNESDPWIDVRATHTAADNKTWVTATSSEGFSDPESVEESPRTSTPEPSSSMEDAAEARNPYSSWKNHLHSPDKTKIKVRGAVVFDDEDIIAGHFDMQRHVDTYPLLNKCFFNLMLNGPPPLVFPEDRKLRAWPSDVAFCNCAANLATNMNLPIGYKFNENGIVVSCVPSREHTVYYRDPTCIYTV